MSLYIFQYELKDKIKSLDYSGCLRILRNFPKNFKEDEINSERIYDEKFFKKLSKITGRPLNEIQSLYFNFLHYCEDGVLDKKQFFKLYTTMRNEEPQRLDTIMEFIFKAFDKDKDGTIDFEEFLVSINLMNHILSEYSYQLYTYTPNQ